MSYWNLWLVSFSFGLVFTLRFVHFPYLDIAAQFTPRVPIIFSDARRMRTYLKQDSLPHSLLCQVENMVRINGDCYVHHIAVPVDAERRPVDRTWSSNPMMLKMQDRRESWDGSRLTGTKERDGGVEEVATAKQLPNGLHAAAPPRRTSDSSSQMEGRPSFRLSAGRTASLCFKVFF